MYKRRPNWLSKPTKRHTLLVCLLWVSGFFLFLVTTTNGFTENIFQRKNILFIILQIFITYIFLSVCKNYFQQIKKQNRANAVSNF